jgi:tyrosinase
VWWKTRGNPNPTDPNWLTNQPFQFHDATGNVATFTASQVLDTTQLLHGYVYDDISDPIPTGPQTVAAVAMVAAPPSPQPEVVGARTDVLLNAAQMTVQVPIRTPVAQLARGRIMATRQPRAFLNLENVTGSGTLPKYDVYIDVPPAGQARSNRSPLHVGSLSLFGVAAASDPSGPQGGSGITSVIEITPQVEQLRREGRWDESRLQVTFMRREVGAWARAPMQDLKIGRISIYYD